MVRSVSLLLLCACIAPGLLADSPLAGSWAFQTSDDYPVWLQIPKSTESEATFLWKIGSARPVAEFKQERDQDFTFSSKIRVDDTPTADGKRRGRADITFSGSLEEDGSLTLQAGEFATLSGKMMPPMPASPYLSEVTFGELVSLFDGKSLKGWKLKEDDKKTVGAPRMEC